MSKEMIARLDHGDASSQHKLQVLPIAEAQRLLKSFAAEHSETTRGFHGTDRWDSFRQWASEQEIQVLCDEKGHYYIKGALFGVVDDVDSDGKEQLRLTHLSLTQYVHYHTAGKVSAILKLGMAFQTDESLQKFMEEHTGRLEVVRGNISELFPIQQNMSKVIVRDSASGLCYTLSQTGNYTVRVTEITPYLASDRSNNNLQVQAST